MTKQLMDSIIIDGERLNLRTSRQIPHNDHMFFKRDHEEINEIYTSSMCHRRYKADYLESNGLIYLIGLEGVTGIRNSKVIKAWWMDGEIETDCSLVLVLNSGRVIDKFVRAIEIEEPKQTLAERISIALFGTSKTSRRTLNTRRIELLRYRKALLQSRIEMYVVGCKRYLFASQRMRNTDRNIERLRAAIANEK